MLQKLWKLTIRLRILNCGFGYGFFLDPKFGRIRIAISRKYTSLNNQLAQKCHCHELTWLLGLWPDPGASPGIWETFTCDNSPAHHHQRANQSTEHEGGKFYTRNEYGVIYTVYIHIWIWKVFFSELAIALKNKVQLQ